MDILKAPCKGCQDRWVNEHGTCHATCSKYKTWKKEQAHEKKEIKLKKSLDKDSYCMQDAIAIRKGLRK